MECKEFDRGVYIFHALGLSEGTERDALQEHLADGCPTCKAELDRAASAWFVYGVEKAGEPKFHNIRPSRGLRRRILNSARRSNVRQMLIPAFTQFRYAAGATFLLTTAVTSWKLAERQVDSKLRDANASLQGRNADLTRLSRELEVLRTARASEPRTINPTLAAPREVTVIANDPRLADLDKQVAELTTAQTQLTRSLTDQQSRSTQLEQSLQSTSTQLTAARQDLERALTERLAGERTLASERAQRDTQLATVRQRVRDLEGQVLEYQRLVDLQQSPVSQYRAMMVALQSPNVGLVRLQATDQAKGAFGTALIADGSRVLFFADKLPALPAGRTYQLWLMRRDGPAIVSAGIFSRTPQGAPTIEFANAALIKGITGVAVSEEPAGGSKLPTGHKLLVGTLRG